LGFTNANRHFLGHGSFSNQEDTMFANQLIWAVWNVLRGAAKQLPDTDWHAPNYSLPRLGDPENLRDPVARLERGKRTFVLAAARAASGV
jgi:hypothetical protein